MPFIDKPLDAVQPEDKEELRKAISDYLLRVSQLNNNYEAADVPK